MSVSVGTVSYSLQLLYCNGLPRAHHCPHFMPHISCFLFRQARGVQPHQKGPTSTNEEIPGHGEPPVQGQERRDAQILIDYCDCCDPCVILRSLLIIQQEVILLLGIVLLLCWRKFIRTHDLGIDWPQTSSSLFGTPVVSKCIYRPSTVLQNFPC